MVEGIDLGKRDMEKRIRAFAAALSGADVGLFFMPGHGLHRGREHRRCDDRPTQRCIERNRRQTAALRERFTHRPILLQAEAVSDRRQVLFQLRRDRRTPRADCQASGRSGRPPQVAAGAARSAPEPARGGDKDSRAGSPPIGRARLRQDQPRGRRRAGKERRTCSNGDFRISSRFARTDCHTPRGRHQGRRRRGQGHRRAQAGNRKDIRGAVARERHARAARAGHARRDAISGASTAIGTPARGWRSTASTATQSSTFRSISRNRRASMP